MLPGAPSSESRWGEWVAWIEGRFEFSERGATIAKESRSALATFFTMSYILLVNPQLLSKIGIPSEVIVVSTALASAVSCFLTGAFGNLPLGLAPGVGLSTYLTYGLVLGQGLSIKEAFTTCFVSGLLLLFFSVTSISELLMKMIPRSVKIGTIVGMGLQIALVGMTSVKLVVANEETIVGLGDMGNYQVWLSLSGLIIIGTLLFHQIEGAILLGIALMTVITWAMESSFPSSWVQIPNFSTINPANFISFTDFDVVKCMPGIAAFTFIGLIDVSGVIYGMAKAADLVKQDGSVPGAKNTFSAAALGTLVSAMTGGTPIIVYVESATGIKEGGRTGFSAILVGLLFIITLPIAPLLASIPLTATAPVAMLIGAMMLAQASEINWHNMSEAIPAFLTMSIMPFTFSITDGIVFGLISAFGFYLTTGQCYSDIVETFRSYQQRGSTNNESELIYLRSNNPAVAGMTTDDRMQQIRSRSRSDSTSFMDHEPFERAPSLILKRQ